MITYTAEELAIWRSRSVYKNWNDAFTGSPPAYAEMDDRAAYFLTNPSMELVDFNVTTVDGSQRKCAYAVASAFKYLVEDDLTHGNAVKSLVLSQIAEAATDFSTYDDEIANPTFAKFSASWVYKFFLCYEYTFDLYSDPEKAAIDTWLWKAGHYYQRVHQIRYTFGSWPTAYFDAHYDTIVELLTANGSHTAGKYYYVTETNSNWIYSGSGSDIGAYTESFEMKDDYTTFTGNGGNYGTYTHINNDGSNGNLIYFEHGNRNNSQGMMARVMAAVGIRTDDVYMQNAAKAYVKEWIKYAVYPDGTSGEYRRNLGTVSDAPQLGTMFYNLVCIENALIPADLFMRQGDNSLYTYTTSEGYQTTAGGSKNLALVLDTLREHITSEYDTVNAKYAVSKSEDNLLCEYRVSTGVRYIPEHIFLRANLYYNSSVYEAIYKLQETNQVAFDQSYSYPSPESTTSLHPISWGGVLGNDPALYFQLAEVVEGSAIVLKRSVRSMLMA